MSKLMVSVSGIRGVFGEGITPEVVMKYASHFGVFCKRGTIVVGRDSRTSGETLRNAVVSGLLSVGCKVVDLGIVSTPTLLLAVEESDAKGGICITASHNTAEWNALKLIDENGLFLFPERAKALFATFENEIEYAEWDNLKGVKYDYKAAARHIYRILKIPYIDLEKIRSREFKVVLDSVNGAGGTISPFLLDQLGCEVIELNTEPTGHFAHDPEPLAKNLTQICQAVKEHKADLGFATDPDVDRLSIISEKGEAIGEEYSLLLATDYVLSKNKGDVVTNLSSSMAFEDIANKYGVNVHRTKVGEINVGKKMIEVKSPIGGEGNGGVICPEVHYTRDAPAGMALILGLLAERGKKVSELVEEIPKYYICKERIEVEPSKLDRVMEKAELLFADRKLDRTDGLKVIGDDYWIHIRKSGTEPIVRIYVESVSQEDADKKGKDTVEALLKGL
ncbi:MAG: phosphoglucosamine mutase [Candidatus Cloacimonas sp.]|nr:phosphoglucosamine mutase [Candidatus Cloacimonadota bacterium]